MKECVCCKTTCSDIEKTINSQQLLALKGIPEPIMVVLNNLASDELSLGQIYHFLTKEFTSVVTMDETLCFLEQGRTVNGYQEEH